MVTVFHTFLIHGMKYISGTKNKESWRMLKMDVVIWLKLVRIVTITNIITHVLTSQL